MYSEIRKGTLFRKSEIPFGGISFILYFIIRAVRRRRALVEHDTQGIDHPQTYCPIVWDVRPNKCRFKFEPNSFQ